MVSLSEIPNTAITLVLVAAVFVAGFLILAGMDEATTDANAGYAIANLTNALKAIIGYAPVWGVLIGVGVLLFIVVYAFRYFTGGKMGGGV